MIRQTHGLLELVNTNQDAPLSDEVFVNKTRFNYFTDSLEINNMFVIKQNDVLIVPIK